MPILANIYINQAAYSAHGIKVSLEAACVMNMMQTKIGVTSFQKESFKENEKLYFWFSHSLILENLPILFSEDITTEALSKKVRRIIEELIKQGLVEKHPNSQSLKKSYYCFTSKADLLIEFDKDSKEAKEALKIKRQAIQSPCRTRTRMTKLDENDTDTNDQVTWNNLTVSNVIDTVNIDRGVLYQLPKSNNNKSLASPIVEAPDEKENPLNDLVDLQTESEQDTPLRPAPSFESQTKPIEVIEPKEAKTDEAIKALKVGDRSKHLHQHFIDAFSNTYKTLSDGDAFLWQGKELIAIKKVREELTNLLYTKYETVSDEKVKETFSTFMASALKDKWMKDNFAPSMLFSKFSAIIILVKKHTNGSRPSAMPVYTAKTVAFTSFT
jgi:hypothetical protein